MIEEKINNSLKELEEGLKDIESARKQVERTVNSYNGLNKTTGEYVIKLGILTTKIQELVDSIGKDYDLKVKEFERDLDAIIKTSNDATDKLTNATEEIKAAAKTIKDRNNDISSHITSVQVSINTFLNELISNEDKHFNIIENKMTSLEEYFNGVNTIAYKRTFVLSAIIIVLLLSVLGSVVHLIGIF